MNTAYLILGGNLGNKSENLEKTVRMIGETAGTVTKRSEIFITAPWGNTEQPDFFNQALELSTLLSPVDLLNELLRIEAANGRVRDEKKWGARTMDIDILFYNDEVIERPHLKIPHPHVAERRFVLAPLAQIAGPYMHPVLKKNISRLLEECSDASGIKKGSIHPTFGKQL